MKEVIIFSLCLITVPGRSAGTDIQQLESFTTGGILIFCKYANQHKDKEKYFCKGNASTCPYNRLTHNDSRVLLYKSVQRDSLTILITNLTSEDSGTYHCAVEDGDLHTSFILEIKGGDCCDSPITIIGREGDNINIPCWYPEESKGIVKHFCKQNKNVFVSELINLDKAKYSLSDKKNGNIFNVTIHNLKKWNAGTYWCGLRTGEDNVALTRMVDLKFTGRKVKGFTRGGIVMFCKFGQRNKNRYFCKGDATTCISNHFKHDSRFKQHNNDLLDYLTVVITNLTSDDAGTYHCVEDEKVHTEIHLSIEEGDCCDLPIEATGDKGGNVSIQCRYSVEFTNHTKHFCKASEGCKNLDSTSKVNQKYSLSDNKIEKVFTVTIYNLEVEDAGKYSCGVRPGEGYVILLRGVELQVQVSDGKMILQNTQTAVLIVALVLAVTLFLCYKNRERGKHDRSNVVIYHSAENPEPNGIYEEIEDICPPPPLPLTSRCNYTKVDNAGDPTYYTIQSPPKLPDDTGLHLLSKTSHTQINTVYATAELPTIPGNVPTYSNIQSPIHTSADTHISTGTDEIDTTESTVYTTVQCPNTPSGIPTPCTDNPDPTNPANQEPKYTSEDTVCKTPHSPTHTSDDTDYSAICSPTSTQTNMVYVNAEIITNANNDDVMCTEKVPLKPID
ncbi:polymeric immunoglobulin receptor-like [Alosa sapidissima]|uniref:polymeric immunoglobulin receptor-like n=1 Tax=Alosa sapidissima TaxID=34773 RepID=UPI001C08EF75|nr:polymeric immunoglobulin receptor-like [Alosa sapidissima]